ncbi:MAG: DNA recombination protein RmuC [bacterium]|nr:DNA recombination protein RmuC [bacterium]
MNTIIVGLGIVILVLLSAILFLLYKSRKSVTDTPVALLQQQLSQISGQLNNQINAISTQVNQRLFESSKILQETNQNIGNRLDSTAQIISRVDSSLGKLYESNQQIFMIGKDISKLSDLLRAPSFRGGIGELMLENLLHDILPVQNYGLKHKFKNGQQVDAVILLGDKLVPVDSKFPYENFKKVMESSTEPEKNRFKKDFYRDVKNHIDKISSSYILPEEGTFDFALMYIPAENVFYETIIKDDGLPAANGDKTIYQYALQKKVVPVSPNSFFAYLQSIVLGLKGLQVEKNAQQIIIYLNHLRNDFRKFQDDFRIVGCHLTNARNKYEESERQLERFSDRLENAAQSKQIDPPVPEITE